MIKVAVVGRSRTARATVARRFYRPHNFRYLELEAGVKRIHYTLNGRTKYKRLVWYETLQMYDALYKVDSNIWIGYLLSRLNRMEDHTNVVCPDARYLNEIQQLKQAGFIIVRVTNESTNAIVSRNKKNAAPGSLILSESYDENFSNKIGVDYSIHHTSYQSTYRAVDQLVEKLINI